MNRIDNQDSAINKYSRLTALTLVSAALLTCSPVLIHYDWRQGQWTSSLQDTAAANEIRNKPVSDSAGKLIWSARGDRLFATNYPTDLQENSVFETETVSQSNFIIAKTEPSFCSEAYGIASDLVTINCMITYQ